MAIYVAIIEISCPNDDTSIAPSIGIYTKSGLVDTLKDLFEFPERFDIAFRPVLINGPLYSSMEFAIEKYPKQHPKRKVGNFVVETIRDGKEHSLYFDNLAEVVGHIWWYLTNDLQRKNGKKDNYVGIIDSPYTKGFDNVYNQCGLGDLFERLFDSVDDTIKFELLAIPANEKITTRLCFKIIYSEDTNSYGTISTNYIVKFKNYEIGLKHFLDVEEMTRFIWNAMFP